MGIKETKSGRPKKGTNPFNDIFRELIGASTQQEAAEKIGVSRQNVGRWLSGETTPDIETLCKIANAYDVSTDYLLGRTKIKTTDPKLENIKLTDKAYENLCFITQSGWNADVLLGSDWFFVFVRLLTSIDEWISKLNYFKEIILPCLGVDKDIYEAITADPEAEFECIHDILNEEFLKIVQNQIGGDNIGGENIPYRGLEYEEKIDLLEFKLDKYVKAFVEEMKHSHKMDDVFFSRYNKLICDALITRQKEIETLLQNNKTETETQYKDQLEAIDAFITKYSQAYSIKEGDNDNG